MQVYAIENKHDLYHYMRWDLNVRYNNCYSYAFDEHSKTRKFKDYPGHRSGMERMKDEEIKCENLYQRVLSDHPDFRVVDCAAIKENPVANSVVAVVDDEEPDVDWHFYMYDGEQWAHKPGSLPLSFEDASGQTIRDPFSANRDHRSNPRIPFNYSKVCFCGIHNKQK